MTIKIIRHFSEGMRTCANLAAAHISSATGRACQVGCLLRAPSLGIDLDLVGRRKVPERGGVR